MSKMGQALDRKLDENKYVMYEALQYITNRCTEIMEGYNQGLTPDKVDWVGIVSEADRRARKVLAKVEGK